MPLARKSKLRKRSKSKATIDKADKALQNWFRFTFKGTPCEVCGKEFEVMHHHILKSQSNAGRYNHDNLIFICNKCHSKISFGDLLGVSIYSAKRGQEWVERMKILKRVSRPPYGKKELERIIEQYSIKMTIICPNCKENVNGVFFNGKKYGCEKCLYT